MLTAVEKSHGMRPGQLIGYPIVKLAKPTELVGFVREIEAALISVCADFGINTQRVDGRSGVWVRDERGDRKIAAIENSCCPRRDNAWICVQCESRARTIQ
jgi:lipoate-protein ligase B